MLPTRGGCAVTQRLVARAAGTQTARARHGEAVRQQTEGCAAARSVARGPPAPTGGCYTLRFGSRGSCTHRGVFRGWCSPVLYTHSSAFLGAWSGVSGQRWVILGLFQLFWAVATRLCGQGREGLRFCCRSRAGCGMEIMRAGLPIAQEAKKKVESLLGGFSLPGAPSQLLSPQTYKSIYACGCEEPQVGHAALGSPWDWDAFSADCAGQEVSEKPRWHELQQGPRMPAA